MRILFVNPYYKPYLGGIERIIERVGERLREYSSVHAVGVLTTRAFFPDRWMPELPSHEVIDGIEVFRCTFRPRAIPRVFHAALGGYVSLDAVRALKGFKPDVVHFAYGEWWGANLNVYLASRKACHVLSPIFHNIPHTPGTAPLYAVNRWLAPRMDAVHVLTDVEGHQVHEAYKARLEQTVVIPPGVEIVNGVPHRSGRREISILAVGRLNAHKGQLRLVHLVREIVADHPDLQIRLCLVGDDAGDRGAIEQYVRTNRLNNVVEVAGHCSDSQLWELYQQADIFALPTLYESFGIVFLEAMAHGLPVITFGVGPVPSVLTQGAILVRPNDDSGFRENLLHLITDGDRRQRLGAEGRRLVERSYSWASVSERFLEMYDRAVQTRRASSG